jgi:hypothetical protein
MINFDNVINEEAIAKLTDEQAEALLKIRVLMELDKAYELVLADLEDRNSHTIGRLLRWDLTGQEDEVMYRAWLSAKQFIEQYEWDKAKV